MNDELLLIEERWKDIEQHLKEQYEISEASISTFISTLKIYSFNDNLLVFSVPKKEYVGMLEKAFLNQLKDSIYATTGINADIEFIALDKNNKPINKNEIEEKYNISRELEAAGIRLDYNFENFIIGKFNEMASNAAKAIVEDPGHVYNPLYLYGGPGLGKTHLMQAVAIEIKNRNPKTKVLYATAETFMNDFTSSIQLKGTNKNSTDEFRNKYRNVDVLLIDDIQFLTNTHKSTQEEFFNTYNALYTKNKTIIVTSDKHPNELKDIEDRIVSRLSQGISCEIDLPDYEARLAILRKKNKSGISDEILQYIAKNIDSNIRELEGCMNKVRLKSALENNETVSLATAQKILEKEIYKGQKHEITSDYIIALVCEYYGVNIIDISSEKRNKEIVEPRSIAMYLCYKDTNETLEKIGTHFNKNHSTVISARDGIEKKIKTDLKVRNDIEILQKKIGVFEQN